MITATEPSAKLYGKQSSRGGCLTCHPDYDFNFFGFSKHGKIRRKIWRSSSRLAQFTTCSIFSDHQWNNPVFLKPRTSPIAMAISRKGRGHFFFRFRLGLRALIHPPTSQREHRDTDREPKMLGDFGACFKPSGKLSHNYRKSPFFMGKSTISMTMFNSKLLVYQAGYVEMPNKSPGHPGPNSEMICPNLATTRSRPESPAPQRGGRRPQRGKGMGWLSHLFKRSPSEGSTPKKKSKWST